MTRKNIDTSREIRLWAGIILSAITTVTVLASDPYVRSKARKAVNSVKDYVNVKKEEYKEKHRPHIEVVNSETVSQEPLWQRLLIFARNLHLILCIKNYL